MDGVQNVRVGTALLGLGLLVLGLYIGYETWRMDVGPSFATVGPRAFPLMVAGGLVLVALALLREGFMSGGAREAKLQLDWSAIAIVSGGLIAQLLVLPWIGWIPSATLLFVVVARVFGSRRLILDLLLGLLVATIIFVAFGYGLDLSLPTGTLVEDALAARPQT